MDSHTANRLRRSTMLLAVRPQVKRAGEPQRLSRSQGELPTSRQKTSGLRKLAWLGTVLAIVGMAGYLRHQSASGALETIAESESLPRQVTVTRPTRAAAGEVTLPATVLAYQAADLFARANGYLKTWHVDIGTTVKTGQVLAEIETPELDQELAQAVASLKQGQAEHEQAIAELEEARSELALGEANITKAQANLDFSIHQAQRSVTLVSSRSMSREEHEGAVRDRDARRAELVSAKADVQRRKTNLETRQAIIGSRQAVVRNREANVQRLRDLTGFQKVVAPFDGIITRRNAEVGMLVSAGSNIGTQPLFSLAQVDVLRVRAAVPQSSALRIASGDSAQVLVPEKPGLILPGKVTRTAGAVEPASRSLLVEVELPNPSGQLLPGIYAQIRFAPAKEERRWTIPAKAVLMQSDGAHVIMAASDGTLQKRKVTLGRDTGTHVEVLIGLQGDERLVINPSSDMGDGQIVRVAATGEAGHKS